MLPEIEKVIILDRLCFLETVFSYTVIDTNTIEKDQSLKEKANKILLDINNLKKDLAS